MWAGCSAPAPADVPVTTHVEPASDAAATIAPDKGVWPDAAGWR
jgi:hypothetical protein